MTLFLEIFIVLAVVAFFVIFFSPSTLRAAITGGPFLPAPKKAIRKALEIAGLKPGEIMYDIGSGLGRVLIIGSKEFKANVVGFEYSFPIYILSKAILFFRKVKNAKVSRVDFYNSNFNQADVIFMFITQKAFLRLKDKLNNLKAGTRVVTYSSTLLFWKPDKIIDVNLPGKIYLYIKK